MTEQKINGDVMSEIVATKTLITLDESKITIRKPHSQFPENLNLASFKPASEVAPRVGISIDRLIQLALDGFCPHIRIDDGEPLFRLTQVKDWVAKNLVVYHNGSEISSNITVIQYIDASTVFPGPPTAISMIKGLISPHINSVKICGIYFLCQNDEVVYVGQSINAISRIGQHSEDKIFDRAFVLPTLQEHLNSIELQFIRILSPKYNKAGIQ